MWKVNEYYLCVKWEGEYFTEGNIYKCVEINGILMIECNASMDNGFTTLTGLSNRFIPATELTKALV
jgi:hypothetical protein